MNRCARLFAIALPVFAASLLLLALLTSADAPSPYGATYTPEELAALDTALHAVNMDRGDLEFKKDYGEGYACFPVIRQMMASPLGIAPWMDAAAEIFKPAGAGRELPARLTTVLNAAYPGATAPGLPTAAPTAVNVDTSSPAALAKCLETLLAQAPALPLTAEETTMLRTELPTAMAWHPIEQAAQKAGYDAAKQGATSEQIFAAAAKLGAGEYAYGCLQSLDSFCAALQKATGAAWPRSKPYTLDTQYGRICIGTLGNDTYTGDFAVLIEPGGNDHYIDCRIGAAYGARKVGPRLGPDGEPTGASADYSVLGDGRAALFIDLGGDDFYDCPETDITLGAAILGVAAFYDLGQGNDRYLSGNCTLGAAVGGVALFYDDGGSDYYSGKAYTQGAAGFGTGVMYDDSLQAAPNIPTDVETPDPIEIKGMDNDQYEAWTNAQAFARTQGLALCINARGNEVYHAGGVYLDAPLFSDRYQSFSQGFAIGERGIDYAGGIALLADYSGNDRYLGDIYNQGVGYWYSGGFLWDGAGNDLYEMTQYGQGSGIHLAVGGLIDAAGHDTYIMNSGLGQGGSHDFAASILMDRGGNDRYLGSTSCNGTGLTNSVGLFFDRSGDDLYAGRRDGFMNGGRPDRNMGSIGVFVDLGGNDDYLSKVMADGGVWSQTTYGAGVDITPPPAPEPEIKNDGTAGAVSGQAPIPAICKYEGALDQKVFDELWEISVRWEVGDNRYIVPEARKRLVAFGPAVLPFMEGKMDNDDSGLAQRAYVDILKGLLTANQPDVEAMLRRNTAAAGSDTRRNMALYLIGELKLVNLVDAITPYLDSTDGALQRRAMGLLGLLGSHAADAKLLELLKTAKDESAVRVSMVTLTDLKVDCYADLRPLLDHPMMTVREALINQLVKNWDAYGAQAKGDIAKLCTAQPELSSICAQRTLLMALSRADADPQTLREIDIAVLLNAADWGVRADAVRVIKHWQKLAETKPELKARLTRISQALTKALATETDPYVKSVAVQ